jgi:hypothetical protein
MDFCTDFSDDFPPDSLLLGCRGAGGLDVPRVVVDTGHLARHYHLGKPKGNAAGIAADIQQAHA